jgi:hypothetical protein
MTVPAARRFVFPTLVLAVLLVYLQSTVWAHSKNSVDDAEPFEGLIIDPDAVSATNADAWRNDGIDAIVLVLDERFEAADYQKAAKTLAASGLRLYYWIEVGRNSTFAGGHPEWMASLGSHDDWRKRFPDVRQLQKDEVVKAWPWTPIAYRLSRDV